MKHTIQVIDRKVSVKWRQTYSHNLSIEMFCRCEWFAVRKCCTIVSKLAANIRTAGDNAFSGDRQIRAKLCSSISGCIRNTLLCDSTAYGGIWWFWMIFSISRIESTFLCNIDGTRATIDDVSTPHIFGWLANALATRGDPFSNELMCTIRLRGIFRSYSSVSISRRMDVIDRSLIHDVLLLELDSKNPKSLIWSRFFTNNWKIDAWT